MILLVARVVLCSKAHMPQAIISWYHSSPATVLYRWVYMEQPLVWNVVVGFNCTSVVMKISVFCLVLFSTKLLNYVVTCQYISFYGSCKRTVLCVFLFTDSWPCQSSQLQSSLNHETQTLSSPYIYPHKITIKTVRSQPTFMRSQKCPIYLGMYIRMLKCVQLTRVYTL